MMFKKISFVLALALPFVASADDYTVWYTWWVYSSQVQNSTVLSNATLSEAQETTLRYCNVYVQYNSNAQKFSVVSGSECTPQISNNTTHATYSYNVNVPFSTTKSQLQTAISFALSTFGNSIQTLQDYIWGSWQSKSINSSTTQYSPTENDPIGWVKGNSMSRKNCVTTTDSEPRARANVTKRRIGFM